MDIPTSAQIIDAIEQFLVRHGNMKPSRFGREATGDANLIADLRAGAMPKLDRLHRISAFMVAKDRAAGFAVAEAESDHADSDTLAGAALS